MIHRFSAGTETSVPDTFTDPFRYAPHPLVQKAADEVIRMIGSSSDLSAAFSEGKMTGVLVVSDTAGEIGYLAAFSGNVGGKSRIEGFVPPIYDLLSPDGHYKIRESEITAMNLRIEALSSSGMYETLKNELILCRQKRDEETGLMKARMAISKRERDDLRSQTDDRAVLSGLIRESQHEKAELRRLRLGWEERIDSIKSDLMAMEDEIQSLKDKRASMSDELQKWIFSRYIVHNALGEEKSIGEIFGDSGMIPPGGTGECAAPKLLEYAYRTGLKPLAMGEFWYGASPQTAVRTHGRFYPSCTSKCGPLLGFMLKGLPIEKTEENHGRIRVIHEDEHILAVMKPSGMPSVPGLDGKISLLEIMKSRYDEVYPVHRLDMDTSGLILFARTMDACIDLQKQFEAQEVEKAYIARLSDAPEGMKLKPGDKGEITLALSPDYDERPRQKVDRYQGKPSHTSYEVLSVNADGTIDIIFHPRTGRTHQLRVHSAHILGLGHPILGDLLYGGTQASRLHLHASSITFRHPSTSDIITLESREKQVDGL